jgi:hypothetical protein
MKNIMASAALLVSMTAPILGQIKFPAPSPRQKITQEFGTGSVEVNYCRPSMKGRKIFGELEKFGEVWRTGANEATTIRFTEKVTVAQTMIDTGTYSLFTIPDANEWTVIINKVSNQWGAYDYKQSEDVLRFKVKPNVTKASVEMMTIDFVSNKMDEIGMRISWENTEISFPISMDVKGNLKAKINAAMQSDKKPYGKAAQFYNEIDNDKAMALKMCDEGIAANPKDAYKMQYYKVKVLQGMNNNNEARLAAEKALAGAKAANDNDYADALSEMLKSMPQPELPAKKKGKK